MHNEGNSIVAMPRSVKLQATDKCTFRNPVKPAFLRIAAVRAGRCERPYSALDVVPFSRLTQKPLSSLAFPHSCAKISMPLIFSCLSLSGKCGANSQGLFPVQIAFVTPIANLITV